MFGLFFFNYLFYTFNFLIYLGVAVRQLPITPMTITEVVRLVFETSGYYTSVNVKMRQTVRGGLKCYEDEGFLFALQNSSLMERLKIVIFDSSNFLIFLVF